MKPGYIFFAVFVVALLMALGLPQLSSAASLHTELAAAGGVNQPDPAAIKPSPVVRVNRGATSNSAQADALAQVVQPTSAVPVELPTISAAPGSADSIPLTSIETAPDLQQFINSVLNHRKDQVVGVYSRGLFALPVMQQPAGDQNYISPFDGVLTQYAAPLEHGVISLLAHNFLAGRVFYNLRGGDEVTLVYGDGRLVSYRVDTIDEYQALSPTDPYSDFIDQADPDATVQSYRDVFNRYYAVEGQLVFQTCIERAGDLSWGRIFVVALPE